MSPSRMQTENKQQETRDWRRSANCKATDWKNSCWCRLLVEQENALGSWWKPPAAAASAGGRVTRAAREALRRVARAESILASRGGRGRAASRLRGLRLRPPRVHVRNMKTRARRVKKRTHMREKERDAREGRHRRLSI